jgi:hypothetical protein
MKTPRCIVELPRGKLAGTKAILAPGEVLRVGRTSFAQLVVPHDESLAGVHFELSWDGETCRILDKSCERGTFLGGESVTEAEVPHGAWIRAGRSDFTVHVEDFSRHHGQPDDEEDAENARGAARRVAAERAYASLREETSKAPLYAVLDAARDEGILPLLREHVEPHRSLYEGAQGDELEDVAPYLVGPMAPGSRLLARIVELGWGNRWGIWCTSRERFQDVRRHFRRFLMVELERTKERVYFRFYDPRVMRAIWPVSWASEKSKLLGACGAILLEGEKLALERLEAAG